MHVSINASFGLKTNRKETLYQRKIPISIVLYYKLMFRKSIENLQEANTSMKFVSFFNCLSFRSATFWLKCLALRRAGFVDIRLRLLDS